LQRGTPGVRHERHSQAELRRVAANGNGREGDIQRPGSKAAVKATIETRKMSTRATNALSASTVRSSRVVGFASSALTTDTATTSNPKPSSRERSHTVADLDPDEVQGVVACSRFLRPVIGMLDGGWGLLDGMNDAGLAVSLTFGGRFTQGPGFAATARSSRVDTTRDDHAVAVPRHAATPKITKSGRRTRVWVSSGVAGGRAGAGG
jgi:hypothetical protein